MESIVFISDDNVHDYHAVNSYMELVARHLIQKRNLDVTRMVRCSDNCACQYKSKSPITDIAHASADYSFLIHHNYFGSRHGKGASNGESAVVKNSASQAVNSSSAVITNGKDLYEFCVENIQKDTSSEDCLHFRRYLNYIEDVKRERERSEIQTLRGTRSLHSILSNEDVNTVWTRCLSCFCQTCVQGSGVCANAEYVDAWLLQKLSRATKDGASRDDIGGDGVDTTVNMASDDDKDGQNCDISSHDDGINKASTRNDISNPEGPGPDSLSVDGAGDGSGTEEVPRFSNNNEANMQETKKLQVGSYVAFKFTTGKKNFVYLTMVQGITNSQVGLKFLQRRKSGPFQFTNELCHLHPLSGICGVMSPPAVSLEQRAYVYKLCHNELDQVSLDNNCSIK